MIHGAEKDIATITESVIFPVGATGPIIAEVTRDTSSDAQTSGFSIFLEQLFRRSGRIEH
jgi:hypothetical protein